MGDWTDGRQTLRRRVVRPYRSSRRTCNLGFDVADQLRVVVAYSGAQNANRLISKQIASGLADHGWKAVALPVARVRSLSFDAAVVGATMSCGMWGRGSVNFVKSHKSWLASRPTWIFSVAPPAEEPAIYSAEILGIKRAIGARGHAVFTCPADFGFLGYYERAKLKFDIERWVRAVADELGEAFKPPSARLAA